MKRKYTKNFKNWVENHNPNLTWNWDDPKEIKNQLIDTIIISGDLDIENIFEKFYAMDNLAVAGELNLEQKDKLIKMFSNNLGND